MHDYLAIKNPVLDAAPFLDRVGLSPDLYLGRMVDKCLSGGERKRIELASVLALASSVTAVPAVTFCAGPAWATGAALVPGPVAVTLTVAAELPALPSWATSVAT